MSMFDGLAREVDTLDIPLDGSALAEVAAVIDRLQARFSAAVGEFDALGMWELDGEGSMRGWLKARAELGHAAAVRTVHTASRMRRLPVTAAAWRDGSLSSGQVDAVVRIVKDHHVNLFAEHEPEVVPALAPLCVADTVVALRDWSQKAEAVIPTPLRDEDDRELSWSRLEDGTRVLRGHFDADAGQLIDVALRLATTKDDDNGPGRSGQRKRADALVDVCKFFVDNQTDRGGGSHRPHLNVIVTHEELVAGRGGRYSDGTPMDQVALSTVLCDCNIHRVLVDAKNATIDYGRETKTISAGLRTALIVRDRGCRYPGCDRPATWTDGHHVHWWRHGGATNLHNLVLLCRAHHRTLHKPGWRATLEPDGTLHITDPTGHTRTTRPPGFQQFADTG